MTNLTKRLEEVENAIKAIMATAELPEGFNLNNSFNLERQEDRERCERLKKWITEHPEYEDKIYIIEISKIDISKNPITQEK